jgi:hypothetical protein
MWISRFLWWKSDYAPWESFITRCCLLCKVNLFDFWLLSDTDIIVLRPDLAPDKVCWPHISLSVASWGRSQGLDHIPASRCPQPCSGFRAWVAGNDPLCPSVDGSQAGQKAFPRVEWRKSCQVEMKRGLDRLGETNLRFFQYVRRQADRWTVKSLRNSIAQTAFAVTYTGCSILTRTLHLGTGVSETNHVEFISTSIIS